MRLRLEHVRKEFEGNVVLDDISLEIPTGSFTSILAPTGAGKTTLLRIMSGIDSPTSGKVYYDDEDVTNLAVQERGISMVYQEFINYPSLTIYENVASPLRVARKGKKLTKEEIDKKVKGITKFLKIDHLLNHIPAELSGGEQQRTAIARALIKGSKFIFLDEPLANLDYKLREELRTDLKTVFKGTTIINATPEPIDALAMSTHLGFLDKGKIVQFGLVQEVYERPRYTEVGYYFSSPPMNMFEARRVTDNGNLWVQVSEELKFPVGNFKDLFTEDNYIIGIRPQAFHISKQKGEMTSFENTVEFSEVVGGTTSLHLVHGEMSFGVQIETPLVPYRRNQLVTVYLDPKNVYIYGKKSNQLIMTEGQPVTWS